MSFIGGNDLTSMLFDKILTCQSYRPRFKSKPNKIVKSLIQSKYFFLVQEFLTDGFVKDDQMFCYQLSSTKTLTIISVLEQVVNHSLDNDILYKI